MRLSALDAAFLALESAEAPMHVGWAAVFSPPVDGGLPQFEAVRAHVEGRLGRAPRYRQRLAEVPLGVSDPVWVDDESVDIAAHVRCAPSVDFDALVDEVLSTSLQRDRPLWELWIADGLEGGRLGVVGKAHHCLVDGLGAVELMALLLDLTPERETSDPVPWVPRRRPGPLELVSDAVGDGVARAWKAAQTPLHLARSPRQVVELPAQGWRTGKALFHTVAPPAPSSRLNGPMTARRHLARGSRPLEDLKVITRRFGTTINDVLLAASAGAMRALQHDRQEPPTPIKAMVPVSVGESGGEWGNRIAFLFLPLPCQEADPLWRLRDVHVTMRDRKQERESEGADALLEAMSYAPRPVRRLLSHGLASPRISNLTISNIPGPPMPLYLMGCPVERAYPVVPLTPGHGVSIGMTTVAEHACFGIYAQAELAADADQLVRGVNTAVDELLALCKETPQGEREALPMVDASDPG